MKFFSRPQSRFSPDVCGRVLQRDLSHFARIGRISKMLLHGCTVSRNLPQSSRSKVCSDVQQMYVLFLRGVGEAFQNFAPCRHEYQS